jgi:hypothetical protein
MDGLKAHTSGTSWTNRQRFGETWRLLRRMGWLNSLPRGVLRTNLS